MAIEIPDCKTPLTKEAAVAALWEGWLKFFGSAPTQSCIEIIAAQWGIETGWGKSCHNWNFGNVKSREGDGFDYQYFACNELLSRATADGYAAKDPEHAKIQAYRPDGKAWIWFYPPHSGCRFRAFSSPAQGALDHIALLAKHFGAALHAAVHGDAILYAHALRAQGYYTADEDAYAAGLVGCLRSIQALPIDYDTLPVLSAADKERLDGWIAASIQLTIDDGWQDWKAHRQSEESDGD